MQVFTKQNTYTGLVATTPVYKGSKSPVIGIALVQSSTTRLHGEKDFKSVVTDNVDDRESTKASISPSVLASFRSDYASVPTESISTLNEIEQQQQPTLVPQNNTPRNNNDEDLPSTCSKSVNGCLDGNPSCIMWASSSACSEMEYEHHDVRLPLPNVAAENDRMVDLSNRCLSALLPDIGLCAAHMTRVDLSNNALKELPYEIGHLRQLQWINVSNNSLELLPPTIAFWQHLHTMNASGNHLTDIPTAVRHLDKLAVLNLANNRLTCVPAGLWKLRSLCLLDLSYNQIDVLPARIFLQGGVAAPNRGTLESILLDGCPLVNKLVKNKLAQQPSFQTTDHREVPSLVDIILHRMIENNDVYPYDLPEHIQQRLNSFVACDYCHKMYPANTGAKRLAFITRDRMELPIEYSLCRAHWDNEKTRIALLFAPRKPEYAQQYEKPRKAALLQIKSNLLGYNDGIDPNFHAATSTKPPERLSLGRRMLNTLARKKSHANGAANRMSLPEKTKPKAHLAQHIDDAEITTGVGSLWAIWQHFEDDIVAV